MVAVYEILDKFLLAGGALFKWVVIIPGIYTLFMYDSYGMVGNTWI